MARDTGQRQDRLAADIRRQFTDLSTARFLHAMPAFRVVSDIPDHLKELLDRLETSEGQAAGRSQP